MSHVTRTGWLLVAAVATFLGAVTATLCPARAPADAGQIDLATVEGTWTVPDDLTIRVRVVRITPPEPTAIQWRRMGEGLGGAVIRGSFCDKLPIGQWSPPVPVKALAPDGRLPGKLFLTVTAGNPGRPRSTADRRPAGHSTDVEMEFEFTCAGKIVRELREAGPDGGTVGIIIPAWRLAGGRTPADPAFLQELSGLLDYARRRAEWMEKLPWAAGPAPRRYLIITNIGGYGEGIGYGIRHTNKAIVEAECRALRRLGVNGLRGAPEMLKEMIRTRTGFAADFSRLCEEQVMGYPVPAHRPPRSVDPEAGCPYAEGVARRTAEGVARSLEVLKLKLPVEEVWALTVDEIGSVFDLAPEGKAHPITCERCAEGFRQYLGSLGLRPEDLGRKAWGEVRPAAIWSPPSPKAGAGPAALASPAAVAATAATGPASAPAGRPAAPDLTRPEEALLAYHTAMFGNYASARLFAPLRDAFSAANARKGEALRTGPADAAAARQPWVYSFALRGNTFLMKGHSLDFFDFYRQADNAFVYETSNRDGRIWQWDSYLCDVGRCVSARMGKQFGIYVKPHRGAPVQRALSAISRGARMIYWYTYGPDYHKGDSFSQDPLALAQTAKAAGLIGRAEEVLYGSRWLRPAEVAVVSPRSAEIWMRLDANPARDAAWENAKWVYMALAHAHIPVDAIDETMLAEEDLSPYRAIYISGPNLTAAAAGKLARWVQAGGVLYTSGWGLARDEANRPLRVFCQTVLGLADRTPPEMYYRVALYGATSLERYDEPGRIIAAAPEGARVIGDGPGKAGLAPTIGREVLRPLPAARVLARFADGGPALTCHPCGKGRAYVAGFFPGLEYSAAVRHDSFDMSSEFDAVGRGFVAAAALEVARPVVDADRPTVEGVLLVNEAAGRRAVTLMNWAYRVVAGRKAGGHLQPVAGIIPTENLRITIRGAGNVRKVTSIMLDRALELAAPAGAGAAADSITVILPRLDEGDVLLLD